MSEFLARGDVTKVPPSIQETSLNRKQKEKRLQQIEQQIHQLKSQPYPRYKQQAKKSKRENPKEALSALVEARKELLFSLLSKSEQEELLNSFKQAEVEGAQMFVGSNAQRREALLRMEQIKRQIPEKQAQALIKKITHESIQKINDELSSQETIAGVGVTLVEREAVAYGLGALRHQLEQIKNEQDALPSVIIYPETSARVLSRAVLPLLRKMYPQQHLPLQLFVKTAREDSNINNDNKDILETSNQKAVEKIQQELINVEQKKQQIVDQRDELLRHLQKIPEKGGDVWQTVSQEIQKLHQEYVLLVKQKYELKQKKKEQTLEKETEKQQKRIQNFANRIQEIVQHGGAGSFLVIDDVMTSGHTFYQISQGLKTQNVIEKSYFFAFGGDVNDKQKIQEIGINPSHMTFGFSLDPDIDEIYAALYSKEEAEKLKRDYQATYGHIPTPYVGHYITPKDNKKFKRDFSDLLFEGFSYRGLARETAVGVEKNLSTAHLSPYVSKSPKANPELMAKLRKSFFDVGQKVVDEMEW